MTRLRTPCFGAARPLLMTLTMVVASANGAAAADRYAMIVTGASGGESYAMQFESWRTAFVTTLRQKYGFDDAHLTILAETDDSRAKASAEPGPAVLKATREEVQRVLGDFSRRLQKDDLLFIVLIGHGTAFNGEEGKFNLVGPDLSSSEWADLLRPIAARVAFVDTTGASFPFLSKLSAKGRLVVTATDSVMQQYDTVFPEYFLKAFSDPAADLDKNGRASLWEVFTFASARVREYYEQQGRLPTERPILDDDGDGVGREAQDPGSDGVLARTIYLDAGPATASTDAASDALMTEREALEAKIEALKAKRESMPAEQYEFELEKLLTELARLSQRIRTR